MPIKNNQGSDNIPLLRFPEFTEVWDNDTLDNLTERIGDGLHGTPEYVNNSEIYFINGNNLIDGRIQINETTKKVSVETFQQNDKNLNAKTLLISINGTIGSIARYNNEKVMLGKSVGYFNFKANPDFFYYLLNTSNVQNYFISELTGSTIKNLSLKTLREAKVNFPKGPEQIKISDFFKSIDEKIQALKKKHSLLEQYKKGVMQKLFSQETEERGSRTPLKNNKKGEQLRFKDENGNDFPEWEVKKLGEIGEIVTGKTPSTADLDLWDGEIQFVTPTDITENKYQFQTQRTIKELPKTRLLPLKSIMFTCIASIGKMSLSITPCVTNQQINSIIPFSHFDNEFVYYALLNIVDYIKSTQSTNTLPIINKTEFSKFEVNIPKDKKEQTAIANFLSSLDEKINQTQRQIEKMEVWKKGLLQKMFC